MEINPLMLIAAIALITPVATIIKIRNKFVHLKNIVKAQEAQVTVQMKRKFHLINSIVATVSGQANFEEQALLGIVRARTGNVDNMGIKGMLKEDRAASHGLYKLLAVAESYPTLQANDGFLKLQGELVDTENRLAYARQMHTDAIFNYNSAISIFPQNILAAMLGFKQEKFIEARMDELEDMKIEF